MAIRENATVKVIGGVYKDETGKVVRIYGNVGVALVQLENGDLVKVFLSELVEIRPQEAEPKTEIPEGAKKISRADFDAALIESHQYMMERTFRNPMSGIIGGLTGTIVGADIADKIFKDQDVVVMTEDQFIAVLWAGCSPEAVNKSVGGKMYTRQAMDVSIAAIMNLRKIPSILFGAENG
jgi:hypothetical protein